MLSAFIERSPFGSIVNADGRPTTVYRYVVSRDTALGRLSMSVLEHGATLQSLVLPDREGKPTDVVLGFDDLASYQAGKAYFGATAGRYANRIPRGKLTLNGVDHQLSCNEGHNHLHGGEFGFDKKHWTGKPTPEGDGIVFRMRSPDGEMGYPGTLDCTVTYRLLASGGVGIDFNGRTDRTTVCNLVNHAYWNLNGHASGSILDQVACFNAPFYTPVNDELLATGEVLSVSNTPFDFQQPKPFGEQLSRMNGKGYDHNLVLAPEGQDGWRECSDIHSPSNGLGMKLYTTEPGVQLYTGGYLDHTVIGKDDQAYCPFAGFTLETQKFPGTPGLGHFPNAILRPEEQYNHRMKFDFYHCEG